MSIQSALRSISPRPFCCQGSLYRFYSTTSSELLRQWRFQSSSSPPTPSLSILNDDDSPVDLSEDNDAVNGVRRRSDVLSYRRKPPKDPTPHEYKRHRQVMKRDFPEGWNPPRKLSREAMDGLRQLHHLDKTKFTTKVLAEKFRISPEAVRRILKSKWEQPKEKRAKQAKKDRQNTLLHVLRDKLRERKEIEEILQEKTGRTRGIDSKDRFTFE